MNALSILEDRRSDVILPYLKFSEEKRVLLAWDDHDSNICSRFGAGTDFIDFDTAEL